MKVYIGPFNKKEQQKVKVRVDKYDLWNVDVTLALIILPVLKKFRETHTSSFQDHVDEMIWVFEEIASGRALWGEPDYMKRIQKGLKLFAEHYLRLWT